MFRKCLGFFHHYNSKTSGAIKAMENPKLAKVLEKALLEKGPAKIAEKHSDPHPNLQGGGQESEDEAPAPSSSSAIPASVLDEKKHLGCIFICLAAANIDKR